MTGGGVAANGPRVRRSLPGMEATAEVDLARPHPIPLPQERGHIIQHQQ